MRTEEEYRQLAEKLENAREHMAVEIMRGIAELEVPPKNDTPGAEYYQLKGRSDCLKYIQDNHLPQPVVSGGEV